ncbi:hypothetical protein [Phormidium sp. CCY1219]|uniref:hypothetical protein n=1 Tax=Phormidium sp. CCY1219 TaxID=2886104 RepID=UPI002D1E7C8F|nr:hypothetical protein [Phormidium sp. CCY1219]MEB3831584.1 hypothetical protein [Phormidium sp. CCY1219]
MRLQSKSRAAAGKLRSPSFLGKQPEETWIREIWLNPKADTEELLNGLRIMAEAAVVDESQWMSWANQLALQLAQEWAGTCESGGRSGDNG